MADAWLQRPSAIEITALAVEHLDRDPDNCRVENLRWVSTEILRESEELPNLELDEELRRPRTGNSFVDDNYFVSSFGRLWSRIRLHGATRKISRSLHE